MSNRNDGGPAFPVVFEGGHNNEESPSIKDGMSLRDYFAGQALAGITSNHSLFEALVEAESNAQSAAMTLAKGAYLHADAMMLVRDMETTA